MGFSASRSVRKGIAESLGGQSVRIDSISSINWHSWSSDNHKKGAKEMDSESLIPSAFLLHSHSLCRSRDGCMSLTELGARYSRQLVLSTANSRSSPNFRPRVVRLAHIDGGYHNDHCNPREREQQAKIHGALLRQRMTKWLLSHLHSCAAKRASDLPR